MVTDVYEMDGTQFREALGSLTTPEEVFANAADIYSFLANLFQQSCTDSLLREWAFQWYAEKTGDDYEIIYQRWLDNI